MKDLLQNVPFFCAVIGWFVAQIAKIIICFAREKRLNFRLIMASGGMPSSHSATVCALTTSIAVIYSFSSPLFAIAFIFSFIVMYDAAGVRRAAGEQAKVLNKLMDDLFQGKTGIMRQHLKELIGHTPMQVFVGAAVGILIGIVFPLWIFA